MALWEIPESLSHFAIDVGQRDATLFRDHVETARSPGLSCGGLRHPIRANP